MYFNYPLTALSALLCSEGPESVVPSRIHPSFLHSNLSSVDIPKPTPMSPTHALIKYEKYLLVEARYVCLFVVIIATDVPWKKCVKFYRQRHIRGWAGPACYRRSHRAGQSQAYEETIACRSRLIIRSIVIQLVCHVPALRTLLTLTSIIPNRCQ